ncbi:MAG: 50S ribosomal protein L4 [Candidatus Spechtbacterales bacterium]
MAIQLTKHTREGKSEGTISVSESVLGLKPNDELLHWVYKIKSGNMHGPWAHTKTRSEVRGGGRKPWRQKGTGRARHGSNRSPIWVGGGVTFGPRNTKNYLRKVNKKVNVKAILMALSSKAQRGDLLVVDSLNFDDPKTKLAQNLLQKLKFEGVSVLVYGLGSQENFTRVFRNIPKVKTRNVNRIGVVDILNHQKCIVSKKALENIIKNYADSITHIQKAAEETSGAGKKAKENAKAGSERTAKAKS